jgi:GxxExxY protein
VESVDNKINNMSEFLYKSETYKIIGACYEVHNNLGTGFFEMVYQEALAIEFHIQNIPHEREKKLPITYKEIVLKKHYFADFVCYNSIMLELKALSALTTEHESQLLNYLKATGLKVGYLINFGEKSLKYKRMVL